MYHRLVLSRSEHDDKNGECSCVQAWSTMTEHIKTCCITSEAFYNHLHIWCRHITSYNMCVNIDWELKGLCKECDFIGSIKIHQNSDRVYRESTAHQAISIITISSFYFHFSGFFFFWGGGVYNLLLLTQKLSSL